MSHKIIAALFGLSALMLATGALQAQNSGPAQRHCAPRPIIVEKLASKYGESRQSIGLNGKNQVIEVFASPQTGSWTILVSNPAGVSCIVAAGQAFEHVAEKLPPKGKPA